MIKQTSEVSERYTAQGIGRDDICKLWESAIASVYECCLQFITGEPAEPSKTHGSQSPMSVTVPSMSKSQQDAVLVGPRRLDPTGSRSHVDA